MEKVNQNDILMCISDSEDQESEEDAEEDVKPEIKVEPVEVDDDSYAVADEEVAFPPRVDLCVKNEVPVLGEKDIHQPEMTFSRSGRLIKRIHNFIPPLTTAPLTVKRSRTVTPSSTLVQAQKSPEHRCLLCYKTVNDEDKDMRQDSQGEEAEAITIAEDYRVMFVLKKMLKVPDENLNNYLMDFGGSLGVPLRKWITFCESCALTINKAIVIQKEITRLEEKLGQYETEIIEMIRKTSKSKSKARKEVVPVSRKDVIRVTNETRTFISTGTFPVSKKPANSSSSSHPAIGPDLIKTGGNSGGDGKRKRLKCNSSRARRMRVLRSNARKKDLQNLSSLEKLLIHPPPTSTQMENVNVSETDECCALTFSPPPSPPKKAAAVPAPGRKRKHRQKLKTSRPRSRIKGDNDIDILALKKSTYRCPLCPHLKEEMEFTYFTGHLLFHYRRPYKCADCGTHFSSNTDLEVDSINKIRKNEGAEGHHCSSQALIKIEIKSDKNQLALLLWDCVHCGKPFNSDLERDSHENDCPKTKNDDLEESSIHLKNPCTMCHKKFRNVVEWRLHMVLEHPEVASFGCYYCDETFPVKTKEGIDLLDYEKLRSHLSDCHYFHKFEIRMVHDCDICGEPFRCIPFLNEHMESQHKIHKNKTISCQICQHRTQNRSLLLLHLRHRHYLDERKVFICDQCGYKTVVHVNFDIHKFMKHGIEPLGRPVLNCSEPVCVFRTIGKKAMDLHKMKEHDGRRKYNCETCGKGFLVADKLKRHQQIHLNKNLKPFQCEICGNSFAVENYLYIHMRLSHQNRPFASTNKKKSSKNKNSTAPVASKHECSTADDHCTVLKDQKECSFVNI